MAKQVLVTGASGLVGSHLAEALETRGHSALAMTRHPDTYSGAGKPIFGDVLRTCQSEPQRGELRAHHRPDR
jgi:nucleoside-diphosphate-sugar epimerase